MAGGRPHVLVATGNHVARLELSKDGPIPRANAQGITLAYAEVVSATARGIRGQLDRAPRRN
eukprot:15845923-Heterocapsa_arctica.AAC.1